VPRPHNVIAIDTGLSECGMAWWHRAKFGSDEILVPTGVEVVKIDPALRRAEDWTERAHAMKELIEARIEGATHVLVEWPEFRGGSALGHAAAARDDVSKLAFLCGMIFGIHPNVIPVPVSKWKGQLKKETVNKRIERSIGHHAKNGEQFSSHSWDAVGIGLWFLGFKLTDPKYFGKGA